MQVYLMSMEKHTQAQRKKKEFNKLNSESMRRTLGRSQAGYEDSGMCECDPLISVSNTVASLSK